MNVKHPSLNDSLCNPIENMQNENLLFLIKFKEWLEEWDYLYNLTANEKKEINIPGKGDMLTKETFFALKITANSILEIVKYIFNTIGASYILLGKFQTNSLEARFGQYRQMSGGNYNISCSNYGSRKKKLKILSLINLHSKQNGNFQLKEFNYVHNNIQSSDLLEIPEFFYDVFNSRDNIKLTDDTMSVLIHYMAKSIRTLVKKGLIRVCTHLYSINISKFYYM